jgi:hypothetical protein
MFIECLTPPNQRLHLTRAPFAVFALDCLKSCSPVRPLPQMGRGRCRAGETLVR